MIATSSLYTKLFLCSAEWRRNHQVSYFVPALYIKGLKLEYSNATSLVTGHANYIQYNFQVLFCYFWQLYRHSKLLLGFFPSFFFAFCPILPVNCFKSLPIFNKQTNLEHTFLLAVICVLFIWKQGWTGNMLNANLNGN